MIATKLCPLALCAVLFAPAFALAQAEPPRFELGAQFASANPSEFDGTDAGFGARAAWWPFEAVRLETEFNLYPGSFPDERGFSRGRVEALFGATAGPDFGRVRPFAKVRPGFVRFRGSSEPFACILIFPPPLACVLATGRTLFAVDIGGGVDLPVTRGAFIRLDVSDRLMRYPGPAFDTQQTVRDGAFISHEYRLAAGAGVRF
jgi:hypothetical protein